MRISLLIALTLAALTGPAQGGQSLPIVLDGSFDDWSGVASSFTDPAGDDGSSNVDFGQVWFANDQDYLYLRFETGTEVQGDEGQSLTMYLDTDNDAGTGQSTGGIGADLVWNLGSRSGTFYTPGANSIGHADIGLLLGPTVSNTEFEIALRRDAVPAGGQALFPGNQIRLFLRDESGGGDRVPDGGSLSYDFDATTQPTPPLSLARDMADHVRVASYNIEQDGLFEGGSREDALDRHFDAIDADVWVISEVWNHDASEVLAMVEQFLPSGPGESWNAVKRDGGNVIVSRFPITQSWEIFPGHRLTGALLDLRPQIDSDLLVVANHWRCCTADSERQDEADALVEFLRDAKTVGGVIDLPDGTPMVAAGDFNLVGLSQQITTLLTGDIQDEGQFGADAAPDWNNLPFVFPPSRHPEQRVGWTWRRDSSSFYPGILDWIFYGANDLNLGNHFILDSRTLSASTLSALGMSTGDSPLASDHSPRVADFSLKVSTATPPSVGSSGGSSAWFHRNVPNPFNPATQIVFELGVETVASLTVFDARGREIRTFDARQRSAGIHRVVWDGRDDRGQLMASGVYLVQLQAARQPSVAQSIVLVR